MSRSDPAGRKEKAMTTQQIITELQRIADIKGASGGLSGKYRDQLQQIIEGMRVTAAITPTSAE